MAKTVSTIKIPYEIDTSIKGSEKTLKDLKAIRSQMAASGIKDSMFTQVDKDIETAEKALSQMLVQINKGFKNSKDITNFSKQFDKFDTIISKIQVGLKGLNLSENFNFNTTEISRYNQQLDQLVKRQEQLEESYKSSIAQKAKDLGLTKDEISWLTKEIKTQEELEEAVKKVAKARETEAKKSISKQVQKSSAAQSYMSGATLNAEDLTYKAVSRRGAKAGTTDLRTKTSSGKVEDMTVDASRVQTTLNQEYAKALTEIANSGKSAAEGIEILQKAMKNYGVEITNTDKLQENFQEDLDKIEQITYENADAGSKGAITKARKKMSLGQTNAQGQLELSREGQELVNSQELQQLQNVAQQLEDVTSKLTASIQDGMNKSAEATENFNRRLEESSDNEHQVSEAMDKGTAAAKEQAEAMEKTNATFDNLKNVVAQVLSLTSAWNGFKRIVQETYNDVKNLDQAFASIAMVTEYSVGEMWDSYDQYADMAQKLGQSTQSVIEASALYYQQGLDTNDSLALTEETMKLATLAGLDFAEATSEMTAAIRGFNMEMDEGQRVTDVYSSLAAGAAAETEGIAYAMSKTASIASNAGMSFENTSAYLTKMIETTQEAPENIGTAMKTIIANFTEMKTNISQEDADADLNINDVEEALKSVGIQLRDSTGQIKDLDMVIDELGIKWDTLDRNTQRYLATAIAGSRQQSRLIALLDDYDRTIELQAIATDSAGSASMQFAKYQDTVENKVNKLKTAWEELRLSFINSEGIKTVLDWLIKLLDKLNEFSGFDFAALGAVWLTFGKMTIKNFISGIQSGVNGVQEVFSQVIQKVSQKFKDTKFGKLALKITGDTSDIDRKILATQSEIERLEKERITLISDNSDVLKDLEAIEAEIQRAKAEAKTITLGEAGQNLNMSPEQINAAGRLNNNLKNTITEQNKQQANEKQKLISQQAGQAAGQAFASSFTTAVTAIMTEEQPGKVAGTVFVTGLTSMIPTIISIATTMGIAVAGATAGISLLVTGLVAAGAALVKFAQNNKKAKLEQEKSNSALFVARKNIEKLTEQQEKLNEEWSESSQKLEEQKNKYDSLTQAQEKLENYASKVALTTEEEEEDFINTQNEIAEQFPELISYYDEQGNAILQMGEAWDVIAEKQKQYYAEAYKEESIDAAKVALNELSIIENQKAEAQALSDITSEYSDFASVLSDIQTLDAAGVDSAFIYENGKISRDLSLENVGRSFAGVASRKQLSLLGLLKGISDNIDESAVAGEQAEAIKQFLIKGGITGIEDKDAAQVIEEFKDSIKNNKKQAEDWQEALNRGKDVIADSSDAFASEEFTAQIIEQTEKVNDALVSIVESDLILEDSYNEATENVQGLMKEFLSTQAGVNLEELQKQFATTKAGKIYYDLEGNLIDEEKTDEAINALIAWLPESEQYSEAIGQVLDTFNDETQSQLNNFYLKVQQNDWGIVEQANEMVKIKGISPEVVEAWQSQQQETIDAYNKLIEKSGEILGENIVKDAETGLNTSSGQILSQILQLSTGAQEQLLSNIKSIAANMGQESAKSYSQEMLNLKDSLSLTEEEFQTAMSTDWANITAENFVEQKSKFMESLEDSMTGKEAEQAWQEFFSISSKYSVIDISLSSDASADSILDSLQERLSETVSSYSGISDIIGSQLENGFISFTESTELKDACTKMGLDAGDYISYGLNGNIYFDTDKLTDDVKGQLSNEDEALEAIRLQTKQKKDQIDAQIAILDGTIKTTNAQNNLTVETSKYAQYLDYAASTLASMGYIEYEEKNITIAEENQIDVEEKLLSLIDISNRYNDILEKDLKKGSKFWDTYQGMVAASLLEVDNKYSETKDSIIGDNKEIEDSLDKVNEAQEKVIEAQNELNEALYGEKYHKNALDFMYNYETALEAVQRTADKAKEALDDLSTDDDIGKNLQDYQNAIHQEAVLLKAESAEYQQAIDNYESVIKNRLKGKLEEINAMDPSFNVNTDIADYLYQGEDGMYYINYDALNLANIPDDFSDFLEESAGQMNEWTKAILDNEDKLAEREKEIEEMHEQAIDNRVSLEDKVQEILKEKYEEEISDVEEKYSAMEEANDEYLDALEDALQKERDLRERSNQWEELAQKEKKLSLMQRDTSGANQTDVLELQNEIQEDREQLLDDTVDDILETLKEQYELQKEAHEQEIEFMNTITEDSNLSAMAAEVINSWPSYEAALDWFYQNDQEFANASDAKREQLTNEWIELYNNSKMYDQMNYDEMKNALNTTDQEIQLKMDEITETATTEGERILNETSDKVSQEISDAKEALAQALEDLADAQKEYAEAVSEGLKYSALSSGNGNNLNSSQINSGNTKAYNTRLEAETAARTLAQAGNTGITIDEKDGKYYVNYTKKITTSNQNIKSNTPVNKPSTYVNTKNSTSTMPAHFLDNQYPDLAKKSDDKKWRWSIPNGWGEGYFYFQTKQILEETIDSIRNKYPSLPESSVENLKPSEWNKMWGHNSWSNANINKGYAYASGGLVNYTGPAWVDGTKSKPEAFLSSDDTRRIGEAAELLSKLPILNSTSTSETQMASSIGDTSIEIHINIDKIESDYDVDDMIERVRQDIVDVANPTGTVQILRK